MAKRNVTGSTVNWGKVVAREILDDAIGRVMISGAYHIAIIQMRAREGVDGLRAARAWSCLIPLPRIFR